MDRRHILRCIAAATATPLISARAQEPGFPSRPIRIIVASAPGALTDHATRLYADKMSTVLRQPVVVENVAGAGSLIAVRQLIKAAPDGYTLLTGANTLVTQPHLSPRSGYSLKDLTGVGEMVRSPSLLVVGSGSKYRRVADIVADARERPGRVTYASGGVGTTSHLPVELLARQAKITLTHVPYKGNAVAVPDVVASRADFMMGTPTGFVELIKGGQLRPLAISSEKRSPKFPDVPTLKELGYPDATYEIWIGMLAPAGMPQSVRDKLAAAMVFARNQPEVVRQLDVAGQVISDVRTPAQFDAVLRADDGRFKSLIADLALVID